MNADELKESLFEVDPYQDFDDSGFELDLQGWGAERSILSELIDEIQPHLIIEVGSWKGASSIKMGLHIKTRRLNTKILCVDTWLGSIEHWEKKESQDPELYFRYRSLRLKNGYPQLYYQFIYNVISNQLQDVIIPCPNTSLMASKWLARQSIRADLIYIDASHDEADAYHDISNYFNLLTNRGVIFGDDYNDAYGVKRAVARFMMSHDVEFSHNNGVWVIRKANNRSNYISRSLVRFKLLSCSMWFRLKKVIKWILRRPA
jgi:hypothetical protein